MTSRRNKRRKRHEQNAVGRDRDSALAQGHTTSAPAPPPENPHSESRPSQAHSDARNQENLANEAKMVQYTRAVMWLTAGLFFVGVVTIGILIVHAVIFHSTDQAARASNRAFIAIREIETTPLGEGIPGDTNYRITAVWTNSGNTEPVDLLIGNGVTVEMNPGPTTWPLRQPPRPYTLLPKGTLEISNMTIGGSNLNLARDRKLFIYVYAFAQYKDVFGAKHLTLSCHEVVAGQTDFTKSNPKGASSTQCIRFNCADEGCRRYKDTPQLLPVISYLD